MGQTEPRSIEKPAQTLTAKADSVLVAPMVSRQFGQSVGSDVEAPLGTVTAGGGGKSALVAPHLMTMRNAQKPFNEADKPVHTVTAEGARLNLVAASLMKNNFGDKPASGADEPVHTVTTQPNRFHLVAAFMAQHNTGVVGHDATEPVSTVVQKGSTQAVVSAGLINHKASDLRQSGIEEPMPTKTAQSRQFSEVSAFLTKYHSTGGQHQDATDPLHTADCKPRFSLVTVMINGEPYYIADIGMRMLVPRELYRAQGFPDSYVINRGRFIVDGVAVDRALTATASVRLCGNSVSPYEAAALAGANVPELAVERRAA
jgi:DNA (cytosine-5)-methyltransferase 1